MIWHILGVGNTAHCFSALGGSKDNFEYRVDSAAKILMAVVREVVVRKGVATNDEPPPCKAVSLVPRRSSTFSPSFLSTFIALIVSLASVTLSNSITMGYVKRKTLRREHETPKRSRFRCLIEQGYSLRDAAKRADVPHSTAIKWLPQTDRRTGKSRPGRPPIISNQKVEEIINWMTGHFNRRVMPLQEIAQLHGIKACDKTLLAAFARYGYHHCNDTGDTGSNRGIWECIYKDLS